MNCKINEKTEGTAIKQLSNPDIYPLITLYVLENKTNATSHPNIGSLKTAIEKEWNKMSEEFILKACWYYKRKKWWPYWVNLLFCDDLLILIFLLKLILLYRVTYYYTWIFLILFLHPIYIYIYIWFVHWIK